MSLHEEISKKKSYQRHLWGKNTDISAMFGANQNKKKKKEKKAKKKHVAKVWI